MEPPAMGTGYMGGGTLPPRPPLSPRLKYPTAPSAPKVEFPLPMHRWEKIVEMTVKEFYRRKEALLEAAKIGKRPAFTVPLSAGEQYQRWMDPAFRASMQRTLPVEEFSKWAEAMTALEQRALEVSRGGHVAE